MPETLRNCHDCGAKPGEVHQSGCDTEQCSACGTQWIQCGCKKHDKSFARWTGLWPGSAEAAALGVDLNTFHRKYREIFFIKPAIPKEIMRIRINFKKPGAGMYSMFLNLGEKLQFYRGRARRIPPDPDNVFNSVPVKYITSIEVMDKKEGKNE